MESIQLLMMIIHASKEATSTKKDNTEVVETALKLSKHCSRVNNLPDEILIFHIVKIMREDTLSFTIFKIVFAVLRVKRQFSV